MSCISISRLCSPNSLSLAPSPDSDCDSLIDAPAAASPALPPPPPPSCICLTMPSRAPTSANTTTTTTSTTDGSDSRTSASHLNKHVHLTNCIHLRARFHVQRQQQQQQQQQHKMTVPQQQNQHASSVPGLPLIKELTALSRTRSLRDPSTSSVLKSPLMKATPVRKLDQSATRREETRGKDKSTGENDKESGPASEVRGSRGEEASSGERRVANRAPRTGSLSRKVIAQLQFQQQQALAAAQHSPSPLSLGVYDDPSIVPGVKLPRPPRRRSNNNSMESDQEEDEYEEDEQQLKSAQVHATRSRSQSPLLSRDVSTKCKSPVVSRELVMKSRAFTFPDPGQQFPYVGGHEDELECGEEPKHGCGIPWHWSRLGQKPRGKSFLGHPDLTSKREQVLSRSQSGSGRELTTNMLPPECMSYSSAGNSDAEVLPLLTEPEASVSGDVGSSVEVDSDNVGNNPRTKTSRKGGRATEVLHARLRERINWINDQRLIHDEAETVRKHKSLSYKYRPRTFRDMVGQTVVTQSLSNAVLRGKIVSVYLFQGPRGTGKSSAARVFAAALNCLSSEELRPCGLCRECVALNLGKSMDVKEFDASRFSGLNSVKTLLESVLLPPTSARYRVTVVDECHTLTTESWNLFFKTIEEPPSHSIIILITTSPEQLPRTVISRCQKYPFTKIKDVEIVTRLRKLASKERIEIDAEALELISSRANGSLRDAETMLDQLGLLGQAVTLSTVQELAGLLPDDKLMELLDFALSGDTMSTVKSVRYLLESGVEPLALMSQLANLITDVLAGSYKPVPEQRKRRFFQRNTLSKEELERLRQALKILLEAEKQVRASNDQSTWLTAAILQFAPDRGSIFPVSSSRSSATQSLVAESDSSDKESLESESLKPGWEAEHEKFENQVNETAVFSKPEPVSSSGGQAWPQNKSLSTVPEARIHPYQSTPAEGGHDSSVLDRKKVEDVWQRVLKTCRSKSLKHFLRSYARLTSLSVQEVHATVEIEFQHPKRKAKAEKWKSRISHAFQGALGCPVEVHLKLVSKLLEPPAEKRRVPVYPLCGGESLHRKAKRDAQTSPSHSKQIQKYHHDGNEERLESAWAREAAHITPSAEQTHSDRHWSIGEAAGTCPSRVPLALVMQGDGGGEQQRHHYSQDLQYDLTGPLKFRKVRHLGPEVIIPAQSELEHANLRLESRTKSHRRILCCWKTVRSEEEKKSLQMKQRRRRRRRACFFLGLVPCARACTC